MHPVVFEIIVFAFVVLVAVFEVIIPALSGQPLFPRLRFRGAVDEVVKAEVEVITEELREKARQRRAEAARLRAGGTVDPIPPSGKQEEK
jgi:hypothetical protein